MRRLAYLAGILGAAAAVAGSPYASAHGYIDVNILSRDVAAERDHVTAIELAAWIRDRRPGLRVVDVRTEAEYEAFHVPTAERVAIDSLTQSTLRPTDTVVLYSEGGAHAAQAWVFLHALGFQHVYFLRGGLYEWLEQVMNPSLASNASPHDSSEFAKTSALSRYFGGTPHLGGPVSDDAISLPTRQAGTAAAVAKIRRRGC